MIMGYNHRIYTIQNPQSILVSFPKYRDVSMQKFLVWAASAHQRSIFLIICKISFLVCMSLGFRQITCAHVTTITHNGLIISIPMESCITVCSLEIVTHLREVVTHLENCGMYYIYNFKPQKFPLICPCNMLHTHIARLVRIIWK